MFEADWAGAFVAQYGLWGIFLLTMLEYACLPMPSEVLLPLAGYLAARAGFPFALTVFVTVAAGAAGSLVCYALGALGGRPLLTRLFRRCPAALCQLERTERWQARTGGLSVMLARVIPLFRTWISFVSGVCRQRLSHFLLYSTIGIFIWNTVLLWGGHLMYVCGSQLPGFVRFLPAAGWLALLFVLWRARRREKASGA